MARKPKIEAMETSDIIAEYNALTGKAVKRFANRAKAEEALAAAREEAAKPKPAPGREPIIVKGIEYRSVLKAFQELELPISKHQAFRKQLKTEGELAFKHDGKTYNFKVKKDQPPPHDLATSLRPHRLK